MRALKKFWLITRPDPLPLFHPSYVRYDLRLRGGQLEWLADDSHG